MLNNLKLSRKFNLFLLAVFLAAVLLSSIAFSTILNYSAERQVADKASLLLQTMLSVRQYTLTRINPELAPRLETEMAFLPQTVPGYSAREVMEELRKKPEYSDFFYKEATLNPTNLRDKADGFEAEVVEQFRRNSGTKEITGYRPSPAGELFYIARPITVNQESCLRCHSTPSAAPKSQLASYGSANGFGWELNEIVGAQIISVPASGVIANARRSTLVFVGIMTAAFALMILVINWLLRQTVVTPLNHMAKAANEVSMGNLEVDFEHASGDEIGKLSQAFSRMKTSLVMALDMLGQGGK